MKFEEWSEFHVAIVSNIGVLEAMIVMVAHYPRNQINVVLTVKIMTAYLGHQQKKNLESTTKLGAKRLG